MKTITLRRLPCFLLLLLFSYCKSPEFSADNLPAQQLRFGSGGGITGVYTTYILLENGQLFRHHSLTDSLESLPELKRRQARRLWSEAEDLRLGERRFHQPGNMSYFLEMRTDSLQHRLTWNDNDQPSRTDVLDFYQKLIQTIP